MAIDANIPLSVQPLNIPGIVGAAQQYQTGQKRNQLLDLQVQQEQSAMPAQAAEQQNTLDIQRLKSTVLGAEGLRQYVDAGDLKGGLAYLQGRKATLDSKKIDSSDTDRAIAAVQDAIQTGDPTKVKAGLDQARAVGEKFGILGKQAPPQTVLSAGAKLVGPEGQTIADNPVTKEAGPLEQERLNETIRHNKAIETGAASPELDPETLNTAVAVVAANPARIRDYASFGKGGQQLRTQIQTALSQKLKESGMTPNDLIQLRARAAAQPANLVKLTQQNAQIQQSEQLARANGQRLLDLLDMVDQTGIPIIEGITRSARAKAGNVDAAELKSVLNSFQLETARLLSGNPTLAGVISDSARNDIQNIAPDNMSTSQAKRIVNRLFTEMDIRQAAAQEQIQGSTAQTTVLPQNGQPSPSNASPAIPSPTAQTGQPSQRIGSDAEYNALPSGAQYTAPDGTTRTKR